MVRALDLPEDALGCGNLVPDGFVVFVAEGAEALIAQQKGLQAIGLPPSMWAATSKATKIAVFALASAISPQLLQAQVGPKVRIVCAGGLFPLPTGDWFDPEDIDAACLEDFTEISSINNLADPPGTADADFQKPDPFKVPLSKYSLLGQASEIEARSRQSKPISGKALLLSQASILYGAPNTGKTIIVLSLVIEGVRLGTIIPAQTFYINADDNSQGIAEKLSFLDEIGVHTLVPGFGGFTPPKLAQDLATMIAEDCCDGVVIIIDIPTTKTGKPRRVPLSQASMDILDGLPRWDKCPWLIPNPETRLPYTDIKRAWDRARDEAGLPGLRIHDLRHSAASFMIEAGIDLYAVGRILGHADHQSTQRYAHCSPGLLMQAVEAGAAKINLNWSTAP